MNQKNFIGRKLAFAQIGWYKLTRARERAGMSVRINLLGFYCCCLDMTEISSTLFESPMIHRINLDKALFFTLL